MIGSFVASCHPGGERKQESVLNYCSFDKDTPDKSFGFGLGDNRRQKGIH
jgi:phage terminase large subunit-like protein